MEHARHVFRALLLLIVVVVVISLGRGFLIPRSFGQYGPYREPVHAKRDIPTLKLEYKLHSLEAAAKP